MINIEKILVPTDFSKSAETAYQCAQEIAEKYGARVDFMHVIPTLKYFSDSISELGMPLDLNEDVYPTIQKETAHKLTEIMNDYLPESNRGDTIVQIDRKPSRAITEMGRSGDYDLIVMAAKGKHDTEMLRGSTTEKVIRNAEIPVFTVDARFASEKVKRILLPTDGSETSFAALPLAITLAATYDAGITLFYVSELHGNTLEYELKYPEKPEDINIYESILDVMNNYLKKTADNISIQRDPEDFQDRLVITEDASSRSVALRTVVVKGFSVHQAIEENAEEYADLVVMATHGHTGLTHFVLGSTTEKVAQYLQMPVVTIKPSKSKKEK